MSGADNTDDEDDRTIFGQKLPEPHKPVRPAPVQTPLHQVKPLAPSASTTVIKAKLPDGPQKPKAPLPSELKKKVKDGPKISLMSAMRSSGRAAGTGTNPVIVAAGDILTLLGRLRTGRVEMHGAPLRDHLRAEIEKFDNRCTAANIVRADIDDARYALAATCDDIAISLPGADEAYWREHALIKTLFDEDDSSAGFFGLYQQLLSNPKKRLDLLELMLVCISLGYQGKYRTAVDGRRSLGTLRAAGYERLRRIVPRRSATMSKVWAPVVLRGRRMRALLPLWIVMGVAAAMVVALFASLAWILTKEAQTTQNSVISLHRPVPTINIARAQVPEEPEVVVYVAPPTGQLDRLKNQFSDLIDQGLTTVQEEGDFIVLRLGDALSFGPGVPTLEQDSPVLSRIAQVLEVEPGGIIIEGHSDNIPLSGRGRYKTNEALSEARAAAVRDVLAPYLSDPARISVVGVGPAKPLDTANTPQARAKNRRVDILLRKEQQL